MIAQLLEQALNDPAFVKLSAGLAAPEALFNVYGTFDAQKCYLTAALAVKSKQALLVVLENDYALQEWQAALTTYLPDSVYCLHHREPDYMPAESADSAETQRQAAEMDNIMQALKAERTCIILTEIRTFFDHFLPSDVYCNMALHLQAGAEFNLMHLQQKLQALGYQRRERAVVAGEFACHGDIIDLVTPKTAAAGQGLRLSFFDIELDQIKLFDLASARAVQQLNSCMINPVRSFALNEADWEKLTELAQDKAASFERKLKIKQASGRGTEAERQFLQEQIALMQTAADKCRNHCYFAGIEAYLPLLYPEKNDLFAYLEQWGCCLVMDEFNLLKKAAEAYAKQSLLDWQSFEQEGKCPSWWPETLPTAENVVANLQKQRKIVTLAVFATEANILKNGIEPVNITIGGREAESLKVGEKNRSLVDKIADLDGYRQKGYQFYAFAPTEKQAQAAATYLQEENDRILWQVKVGNLRQGFNYPAAKLMVFGNTELSTKRFRTNTVRRKNDDKRRIIDFFNDLHSGDYVVHDIHGIGIYRGIKTVVNDGVKGDYLYLEYADSAALYLPMSAINQLQKYIGSQDKAPRLSRFGGSDWEKLKERSRRQIRKLATDLLNLYAERLQIKGFAFPKNSRMEAEFAAGFPYIETDDQLQAMQEVENDMCKPQVMDRIICGDVGFGKTEVAFRACFKAILAGKQVAFIAPTTVLVEQHYDNFCKRVAEFGIEVGLLSRFSPPLMQKKVLSHLQTGECQIVFGTHRLLSKDVKFQNLGLLVVDEEQRFGVDHKEQLKAAYPTVDVLTLSATPIPRTLHMALSGIRNISLLQEAPENRKAVRTYVLEYDEDLLKAAILREKMRGGQVFFLHNNTHTIYKLQEHLQQIMPQVTFNVAHGKMPEGQLEEVIFDFINHAFDVLLCTTIIESGIDMPNVNTLIVTDADRLGLAQLYQIKGRVGRSTKQAYAYITYRPERILTADAAKRIKAISEFTELGSGMKIALQDLEVRGAGNLIGAEQHGQIAAVGYDMYCRMLEEEIQTVKAEKSEKTEVPFKITRQQAEPEDQAYLNSLNCQVNLKVSAYIERELVPVDSERLDLYRRIGRINSFAEYLDLTDEILDRFGDVSPNVRNLLDIAFVRSSLNSLHVKAVESQFNKIDLILSTDSALNMQKISLLMQDKTLQRQLHFVAANQPFIEISGLHGVSEQNRLILLRNLLRRMQEN